MIRNPTSFHVSRISYILLTKRNQENEKNLVVLLLLISVGAVEKVPACSLTEATFEVDVHQEFSIKQVIELVYPPTLKWNKVSQK